MNKRYFMVLYILLIVMLSGCNSVLNMDNPKVEKGQLDLTNWSSQSDKIVELKGQWEFYWNELLEPKDFNENSEVDLTYIYVPMYWNDYKKDEREFTSDGYATYRLTIHVNDDSQSLGLRIPVIQTAYKLWVNGDLMASSGIVGRNNEDMKPYYRNQTVFFNPKNGKVEIVCQVSNFQMSNGGFWDGLQLGSQKNIMNYRDKSLFFDIFNFASLSVLGFYHLIMYLNIKREKMLLYSSLILFAVGIRCLLYGELVINYIVTDFPWVLLMKANYTIYIFCIALPLLFIKSIFTNEVHDFAIKVLRAFTIVSSSVVILTSTKSLGILLPTFQGAFILVVIYLLIVCIIAYYKKKEGALLAFIAQFVLLITMVNDIFYYKDMSPFGQLIPVGLLIFALVHAINTSSLVSFYYNKSQEMSEKLEELNTNLEEKVLQRTKELEESNRQLRTMEKSRRYLIANISHDLRTPITSIQGYTEVMLEGIVKKNEDKEKYLKKIMSKVFNLRALIDDFFLLSQLECKNINFNYKETDLENFLQEIYSHFELDVKSKDINFILEAINEDLISEKIEVDTSRIKQVMGNIISNAIRYTPEGGTIRIGCKLINEDIANIKITDNGIGIKKENLPYVFERYFKSKEGKSGLGLNISKEIIENHGGRIWAESEEGAGTTINICLPIVDRKHGFANR